MRNNKRRTQNLANLENANAWVSLAVCTDGNTHFHQKENVPFVEYAILSARAWRHVTGAQVLLKLVSTNKDGKEDYLEDYLRHPPDGVTVETMRPYPEMDCPGTAQLTRLFAFLNNQISPTDVIITADADAFPVSADLLEPLSWVDKTAWIWQHSYSERTGHSFPMSFIALRSKDWEQVICKNESTVTCISSVLNQSPTRIRDWSFDQFVITTALLQNKICTLANPIAWENLGLSYSHFNDSVTCFHGDESNAHSGMQLLGKSWLHASLSTRVEDVVTVLLAAFGADWPANASATGSSETSGPQVAFPTLPLMPLLSSQAMHCRYLSRETRWWFRA